MKNKIVENKPFTVTIKKHKIKFRAICLSSKNGNGFEKNKIKMLSDGGSFKKGRVFTVEDNWFDFELTGRKVVYDSLSNCCNAPIEMQDANGHGKCSDCKENCTPKEREE